MNSQVFVSYASQDRKRVLDLVDRLSAQGVSVWIDKVGIEGAAMWSQEIVSAIRDCKVFILAISKNSAGSENVAKEVALASEGRKRILPVFLEKADIPESMAYQLAGIQRVDFFEDDKDASQQSVIRALKTLGVDVIAGASGNTTTSHHKVGEINSGNSRTIKKRIFTKGKFALAIAGLTSVVIALLFSGRIGEVNKGAEAETQNQSFETAQPLDTNRLVVLPFKTLGSPDKNDLGYGLVSTLTSKLQPLRSLVVIANESARRFADTELSANEIGKALRVGTIVTGEVQISGEVVQVNIRLIDANTEALSWAGTFKRSFVEFLDLQNEIATQLAFELKGGLDAAEKQQLSQKETEIQEAQKEYQIGRREWNRRNKEGFENAVLHFEKAINLDASYAAPYAGLADTYAMLQIYNFGAPDDVMPKAKEYAERAIEINPRGAEAYVSLAFVLSMYEHNFSLAEKKFETALQINPNYATAYHWYGNFLNHIGRSDEAIEILLKGTQLDPNAMIIKNGLAIAYWCAGERGMALKAVEEQLRFDPYFPPAILTKYTWLLADTTPSAIKYLNEAIEVYPDQPLIRSALFSVHWAAGNRELAKDQLIELHARFPDSLAKARFAELYFMMGREDLAYPWLQKGIEAKEGVVLFTSVIPSTKKYQKQSRFRELFRDINHPLYQF